LQVLVRFDPEQVESRSDEEIVQRWGRLFPPRDRTGQRLPITRQWIAWRLGDAPWAAYIDLNPVAAGIAAVPENCKHTFIRQRVAHVEAQGRTEDLQVAAQGSMPAQAGPPMRRSQSRALHSSSFNPEPSSATAGYIDLNPVAAGIAAVPENSQHTSIRQRVAHVEAPGRTEDLNAAEQGMARAQAVSSGLENGHVMGCGRLRIVVRSTRRARHDRRISAG
jgi:hypothetical protein